MTWADMVEEELEAAAGSESSRSPPRRVAALSRRRPRARRAEPAPPRLPRLPPLGDQRYHQLPLVPSPGRGSTAAAAPDAWACEGPPAEPVDPGEVWVVVTGRSGAGKSRVANRLLLHDRLEPGPLFDENADSADAELRVLAPQVAAGRCRRRDGSAACLQVVDCPSLDEAGLPRLLSVSWLRAHAVLLVLTAQGMLHGGSSAAEQLGRSIAELVRIFGSLLWARLGVAFTCPGPLEATERDQLRLGLRRALLSLAGSCLQKTSDFGTPAVRVYCIDCSSPPERDQEAAELLQWAGECGAALPPVGPREIARTAACTGKWRRIRPLGAVPEGPQEGGLRWDKVKAELARFRCRGQIVQYNPITGACKLLFKHDTGRNTQVWFPSALLEPCDPAPPGLARQWSRLFDKPLEIAEQMARDASPLGGAAKEGGAPAEYTFAAPRGVATPAQRPPLVPRPNAAPQRPPPSRQRRTGVGASFAPNCGRFDDVPVSAAGAPLHLRGLRTRPAAAG
eukprot:TRINITY_DN5945_c0_g1_i4.p1 TRINITY_DN5945_c0_g1~~TRINITY_DN5945_c0_g1_i4.p1  ORF type:complete len:534 (+),score=134.33 TRINITY_DN5945_c0_g1_i4:78-1604(+)